MTEAEVDRAAAQVKDQARAPARVQALVLEPINSELSQNKKPSGTPDGFPFNWFDLDRNVALAFRRAWVH